MLRLHLLLLAWASVALTAPPVPPPPPPPPPPPATLPVGALGAAPPGACEKLSPCELFSQLQEHSRRIAGFSYNVKKADAALTALARQQTAAAQRTERLTQAVHNIEVGLDGLASAAEASNGTTPRVLPVAAPAAPVGPAPAGDWEQAAARELARLGDRLTRLREQVNTSFVRTLRENGDELASLRGRVASLNAQVADLAAAARGETVGRRVVAQGESPISVSNSAFAGTTALPLPAVPTVSAHASIDSATERNNVTAVAVEENPTQSPMDVAVLTEVVMPTAQSETINDEITEPAKQNGDVSSVNHGSVMEEVSEVSLVEVVTSHSKETVADSTISLTQVETEVGEQINGNNGNDNGNVNVIGAVNGNGNGNSNGESVDSLGIELETVRTAFETLHSQVTDLQARCDSRGDELETIVSALEQRLASLEASQGAPEKLAVLSPSTTATSVDSLTSITNTGTIEDSVGIDVTTEFSGAPTHNTTDGEEDTVVITSSPVSPSPIHDNVNSNEQTLEVNDTPTTVFTASNEQKTALGNSPTECTH